MSDNAERKYKYLIVGGGMAAASAVKGIRDVDGDGSIGLISEEADPPYKRPPLSKKLWQGKPLKTLNPGIDEMGAEMHLGRKVVSLDLQGKTATDDQGDSYAYDKLLLATGGTPRTFAFDPNGEVIYFRTLEDYRKLRALADSGNDFAVVGGGFIGSELAAALATNGKRVTLVIPGGGIGERLYTADIVQFLSDYYREKGVELLLGERAVGLESRGERKVLKLQSGREVEADGIVAGLGIEPNVRLAGDAGIELAPSGDGIQVDEWLRTSHPDVYAAGDVVSFYDSMLARRRRVEHEDNANTMGRYAGRIMAGGGEPYHHLPFFYTDMFDLGYEAVGELNPQLETVADWKEPYRKGVVYYLRDGRVVGVLLWNVWEQVDAARRLVAEPGPFNADNLKGRLPEGAH